MKDLPVIEPKEVITTITNMKTGEKYKDDAEWKAKGIPESDIRKDVRVIMPSLDLFGETKQNRQMAITRAQQAKQMLQLGGRIGLRGGGMDASQDDFSSPPGNTGNTGGGNRDTRRELGIKAQFTGPKGTTGNIGNLNPDGTRSRNPMAVSKRPRVFYDDFNPTTRNFNFMRDFRRKVNPLGPLTNVPGVIGFVSRAITPNPFGYGPPNMEFTDPTRNEEGGRDIPIWMQLGYSSEAEYNAAMARGAAPAVTEDPPVNLNKMAYRLMADGGAVMDDEPRQAYGLGSIVKKATRAIKKVAKSDLGKAALLYAVGFGIPGTQFGGLLGTSTGSMFGARQGIFGTYGPTSALKKLGLMKSVTDAGAAATRVGPLSKLGVGAGIAALSALPFLMGDEKEEEEKQLPAYLTEGIDIPKNQFRLMAEGGSTEEKEPVAKKVMPLIDMDGKEKDYRETGGFVDMGRMEKADDVPARLSKNEFVFTADAVRNAGDGSVDKGAEVMYNMMKNLEAGGEVSEESQGLEGARQMFKTSQRLEEVL